MDRRTSIGLVLALAIAACASIPLKQRAVVGLQASELALEQSHDAERTICSPAADKTKAVTHCDGAQAIAIGLTDAKHQAIARLYERAFDVQEKAALALKAWRAGDPPPANLADYKGVVDEILAAVGKLIPKAEPATAKAQAAVDEVAKVAALVGVK